MIPRAGAEADFGELVKEGVRNVLNTTVHTYNLPPPKYMERCRASEGGCDEGENEAYYACHSSLGETVKLGISSEDLANPSSGYTLHTQPERESPDNQPV